MTTEKEDLGDGAGRAGIRRHRHLAPASPPTIIPPIHGHSSSGDWHRRNSAVSYRDWVEIKKGYSHSHTYTAYQDHRQRSRILFDLIRNGGQPLSSLDDALQPKIDWGLRTVDCGRKNDRNWLVSMRSYCGCPRRSEIG